MATDMRKWGNLMVSGVAKGITGSVINIGCGDDIDNEGKSYRSYFMRAPIYARLDKYTTAPVDYQDTSQVKDNAYDVALSFWVLEHVFDVRGMIREMERIAKSIIVLIPVRYPYHPAPHDYWRFTDDSARMIFYNYLITNYQRFDNGKDHAGIFLTGVIKQL